MMLVLKVLGAVIIAVLVLAVAAVAIAWRLVVWMPGRSYRGTISLAADELPLREILHRDLVILADEIGERHLSGREEQLIAAAHFLEDSLKEAGYEPRRQTFKVNGRTVWNVIAERTGEASDDEIIIVGAHYDTVLGSPGANDNGTAVVANLALARAFAKHVTDRTIRFVFFVNEESPYHMTPDMGSLRCAQACRSSNERVVGMISLEMLGSFSNDAGPQRYPAPIMRYLYPTRGNFLAVVGNIDSRHWLHQLVRGLRKSELPIEGIAAPRFLKDVFRSDHAAFWHCGYPAVMVTDTANFRYRHYHTTEDTVDKVNFDALTRVVTALRQCLERIVGVME